MNSFCLTQSNRILSEALSQIPGGIKGMHKIDNPSYYPSYFTKGEGCYLYDVDGNEYVDFVLAKGPLILGYSHPEVDNSVIGQIKKGNLFPTGHTLHNSVAKKVMELVDSAEKVIFYKTGSCATSAAVRLARRYTGKQIILSSGYHGWHDWCMGDKTVIDFSYNLYRFDSLVDQYSDKIAAVILTPEETYFLPKYYEYIQSMCQKNKIVFILDEVKSGFRTHLGCFQGKYGLHPDLTTVSKAISNGFSLSAVFGRQDILDLNEEDHTAGTYDIELSSYAAADTTLRILCDQNVPQAIERTGIRFVREINRLLVHCNLPVYPVYAGGSVRFWFWDRETEQSFYRCMTQAGILFYSYDNSFFSYCHTDEVLQQALERIEEGLYRMPQTGSRGTREFAYADIPAMSNKKGFLSQYPGQDGREFYA